MPVPRDTAHVEAGQVWERDDGSRWKVLRGPTTLADLELPTEGEWGTIYPNEGLIEVVQVGPPQPHVCLAAVFTDGKRRVRRRPSE